MSLSMATFNRIVEDIYRPLMREHLSRPPIFSMLAHSRPVEEPEFWTWLCDITTPEPFDADDGDW